MSSVCTGGCGAHVVCLWALALAYAYTPTKWMSGWLHCEMVRVCMRLSIADVVGVINRRRTAVA